VPVLTPPPQTALNAAEAGMVRRGGPIPLIGLLTAVGRWIEDRHMAALAEAGFDDIRVAHNAVFTRVPAGGVRLTDLAAQAGVSKQAMAEMVDELVAKGYLQRVPDPSDGRAKLLVMAPRGAASHEVTLRIFADIEAELAAVVGTERLEGARDVLTEVLLQVVASEARADRG
jgi:DNA-binding MarR family transcriptional regulator